MDIKDLGLRERKFAETKVKLLNLMLDRLASKTFEEISVKELCEAVPVSEVTFYNYFPIKNDLLVYYIELWSLEADYHTKEDLKEGSSLKEIGLIFDRTAKIIKEIPNLMSEMIAFVARNFNTIRFGKISDAEKLTAFPDLSGIERYEAVPINELFARRIRKAVSKKELPEKTDVEFLVFSLVSIFFGTPIGWTRLDPGRVRELYRHNLELLWKGVKKDD